MVHGACRIGEERVLLTSVRQRPLRVPGSAGVTSTSAAVRVR
jgi:hypothetical protein